MFSYETEYIIRKVQNMVLGKENHVSLRTILSAPVHDAIKVYFRASVYNRHNKGKRVRADNITDIQKIKTRVDLLLPSNYVFDKDTFTSLLTDAVHFLFNYLCRPRWTMKEFFFHSASVISLQELKQGFLYFSAYDYYPTLLLRYLHQRSATKVDKDTFDKITLRIDSIVLKGATSDDYVKLLEPLADFVNYGRDEDNPAVPEHAIALFFGDKELPGLRRAFESTVRQRNIKELTLGSLRDLLDTLPPEEVTEKEPGKPKETGTYPPFGRTDEKPITDKERVEEPEPVDIAEEPEPAEEEQPVTEEVEEPVDTAGEPEIDEEERVEEPETKPETEEEREVEIEQETEEVPESEKKTEKEPEPVDIAEEPEPAEEEQPVTEEVEEPVDTAGEPEIDEEERVEEPEIKPETEEEPEVEIEQEIEEEQPVREEVEEPVDTAGEPEIDEEERIEEPETKPKTEIEPEVEKEPELEEEPEADREQEIEVPESDKEAETEKEPYETEEFVPVEELSGEDEIVHEEEITREEVAEELPLEEEVIPEDDRPEDEVESEFEEPLEEEIVDEEEAYEIAKKEKRDRAVMPNLDLLIEDDERKRFIRKLFNGDAAYFSVVIQTLNKMTSWKEASLYIDEIFLMNGVDPYSTDSVNFTDKVYGRFSHKSKFK